MITESNPKPGTTYEGPVLTSTFSFGGRDIRVVRPADPDRLLDDPSVLAWNRQDDYMPYWAYLWPGAHLLAEAVGREPWAEGAHALEIGCGLGLAGLVALGRGLRVRFTDYDEAPLRFTALSAEANGFAPETYSTALLDWRELPEERYPIILGADVLYESRLVPLVADLLARLLEPNGLALIAGPYRVATEGLDACLRDRGLVQELEPIRAESEHGPVRGTLHRIRRAGSLSL
ncbi:class I SAM-dependent methyltransferase [Singulisphaera acidiphila]|uniref:Putative methyltransferase n=1 Tax=Singulisphaera acidiphila (strain ATCC BAA-1392 / DSM 18658 / VKM B-2454 / MOB10) TaxID=886293 RepID=L0D8F4_SINAD|nr:methyltransferase [Singulisphaera acidiphila]AGA25150.1 putative methyltransferase [Singulisphaera acidiphila DSM 18658]